FMGYIEENFINTQTNKPLLYLRYIDDILIFWTKGKTLLNNFIVNFNSFHPFIKFSHDVSDLKVNFLDVTIGAQSGQIYTNLYRKPTDKPQYLHFSSEHPHHTKISLPYSLALRCKRICSQEDLLENHFNILKNQFLNRSYPENLTDNAIGRAYGADDVTYTKNRNRDTAQTVNFITTYPSQSRNF